MVSETKTNQGEANLEDYHILFRSIEEYNNDYQIKCSKDETWDYGYVLEQVDFEYNDKGLLVKEIETEKTDQSEETRLVYTTYYQYDNQDRLVSIISKDDEDTKREETIITYEDNKINKMEFDYSESTNPRYVYCEETAFDEETQIKIVTVTYSIYDYEEEKYVESISKYNSKDLLIEYSSGDDYPVVKYSYNENNDLLEEITEYSSSNGDKMAVEYDENGYLKKSTNYFVEDSEETVNYVTLFNVDSDGYVYDSTEYEYGFEETPSSVSIYELSDFQDVVNPNLGYYEGNHIGNYFNHNYY